MTKQKKAPGANAPGAFFVLLLFRFEDQVDELVGDGDGLDEVLCGTHRHSPQYIYRSADQSPKQMPMAFASRIMLQSGSITLSLPAISESGTGVVSPFTMQTRCPKFFFRMSSPAAAPSLDESTRS